MSTTDYTKDPSINANSSQKQETTSARSGFNKANYLENRIAKASPKAQEEVRKIQSYGARSMSDLKTYQGKIHEQKVAEEKNKLFQKYFNEDALRPTDPESKKKDLEIIDQQAETKICQREEWHQKNLERATESHIRACLDIDRENQQEQTHKASEHVHNEIEPEMED